MRTSMGLMLCVAGWGLVACGDGGSAVETRDRAGAANVQAAVAMPLEDSAATTVEVAAERPAMTANRRETTDAKIQRLFERNGADFGARSAEEYLARVQAFIASPPSGTERVERPNGDVLLYQASTNTFAVISRDGVPKTMFKPRTGGAYWAEQKEKAPTFGRRRASNGGDRSNG